VLCLHHARTHWVARGHGIGSTATFKPMSCLFLRSFLRSLCTAGIEQPSSPGLRKARAAGADGNRGTAVPPFPQRYDCYEVENKNNGRTSKASGRRSRRLRRKSYLHRLPPNMGRFRPPSTQRDVRADLGRHRPKVWYRHN
jgi:hypothetical protein